MAHKKVLFGSTAREKVLQGAEALTDAVGDGTRNEYVDLVEAGIINPTKVVRIALENAVSIASVLLLTEATMTDIPEPEKSGMGQSPQI